MDCPTGHPAGPGTSAGRRAHDAAGPPGGGVACPGRRRVRARHRPVAGRSARSGAALTRLSPAGAAPSGGRGGASLTPTTAHHGPDPAASDCSSRPRSPGPSTRGCAGRPARRPPPGQCSPAAHTDAPCGHAAPGLAGPASRGVVPAPALPQRPDRTGHRPARASPPNSGHPRRPGVDGGPDRSGTRRPSGRYGCQSAGVVAAAHPAGVPLARPRGRSRSTGAVWPATGQAERCRPRPERSGTRILSSGSPGPADGGSRRDPATR